MQFTMNLHKQTPKVEKIELTDEKIAEIREFRTFARRYTGVGVGLAANQCLKDDSPYNERFCVLLREPDGIYINPEILGYYGRIRTVIESCLSHPNKKIQVKRYDHIWIRYTTIECVTKTEFISNKEVIGNGITRSQVLQHEVDHLNGIEEIFVENLTSDKVGRNSICTCGSGKKYKKCCGRNK